MCELETDRSALARLNFPEARHFALDINSIVDDYCKEVETRVAHMCADGLFLISCTAPCQGMSKSGQGTLLRNIREGKRPQLDPRNRLILPALDIIGRLRPHWVVFENVLEMRATFIEDNDGILRNILDIIHETIGSEYAGEAYDVEFADYGVPQRRQRLITVFTKDEVAKKRFADGLPLIPAPTHSATGEHGTHRWISVIEALKGFPPLDSIDKERAAYSNIPFHYVPVLDPKKYEWIRHAPPGTSAFDNQCINPDCRYERNPTHGTAREEGINRASKDTPLYCERCGALLPRPYTVQRDGKKRIMSGYTSAYKRMDPDLPAPALTRNLSYPCSDNKVHPYQNRVLSLAEAAELQTITRYEFKWGPIDVAKKLLTVASDGLIRLVIGESVPPMFLELLGKHIRAMSVESELPETLKRVRQPIQMTLL
jgi:DNA (cytosine-5)-methyltransferase 1